MDVDNSLEINNLHANGVGSPVATYARVQPVPCRHGATGPCPRGGGGAVERSYARSDLFDQRRGLMDRWAASVTDPVPTR